MISQARRSTVLHTTARSGDLPVVRELVARKVDPNPRLPDGRTPRPVPPLKKHERHNDTYTHDSLSPP